MYYKLFSLLVKVSINKSKITKHVFCNKVSEFNFESCTGGTSNHGNYMAITFVSLLKYFGNIGFCTLLPPHFALKYFKCHK